MSCDLVTRIALQGNWFSIDLERTLKWRIYILSATFLFAAISVYGYLYPIHRQKVTILEDVCQSYAGDTNRQNDSNTN
jgi:hypothetical protein